MSAGFRLHLPKDGSPPRVEHWNEGARCRMTMRGRARLILLGDPIGASGPLEPEGVLERYAARGPRCVDELDGCFLLAAVDEGRRETVVVTDRMNGLKCFVEESADGIDLVSSLRLLPARPRRLDAAAAASFLVNAALYGGRTIFEGVRLLPRGSVHVISGDRVSSREYQSLRFDGAFATRAPDDLRRELAELLLRAVSRRAPNGQPIVLSLSGGDSSTAILGSLRQLDRRDACCFTYSCAPHDPLSETRAASRLASAAGLPHFAVPSFSGDLDTLLAHNVLRSECRANLCLELEAWQRLERELPADTVILVGDGAFGWWCDESLRTPHDALAAVPLYASRELGPLREQLGLTEAFRVMDEELAALAARAAHDDPNDTRDFLFLDQRLPNLLMPWRELFPGRPVRSPFLDRDVLEFLRHLPATYRSGRRLLKETVYDLFPELYALDRTCRPASPWPAAIAAHSAAFESELRTTTSPVDAWIPPDAVLALLEQVVAASTPPTHASRTLPPRRDTAADAGRRARPESASATQLLLRIVALRRFARRWAGA